MAFEVKVSFSGLSVKNLDEAKQFYSDTLGFKLIDDQMGLRYQLPGSGNLFIYLKTDHQPATFTVLNLVVDDIDQAVDALTSKGISFERYDNMPGAQDQKGVMRGLSAKQGPDIAWFKDPAGNILSVLQIS